MKTNPHLTEKEGVFYIAPHIEIVEILLEAGLAATGVSAGGDLPETSYDL